MPRKSVIDQRKGRLSLSSAASGLSQTDADKAKKLRDEFIALIDEVDEHLKLFISARAELHVADNDIGTKLRKLKTTIKENTVGLSQEEVRAANKEYFRRPYYSFDYEQRHKKVLSLKRQVALNDKISEQNIKDLVEFCGYVVNNSADTIQTYESFDPARARELATKNTTMVGKIVAHFQTFINRAKALFGFKEAFQNEMLRKMTVLNEDARTTLEQARGLKKD